MKKIILIIVFFCAPSISYSAISVIPVSGLVTTESGTNAAFSVVLTLPPSADVTIGLSSSDIGEGTVSPASLIFTIANWNTPQIVTVTGVDDALTDGNIAYSIVTAAAISSGSYSGIDPSDVSVTNLDDDSVGISVSPIGITTSEAGGSLMLGVVLDCNPIEDITIALSSSDTSEGTVNPASLTFTSGNWSTLQPVTVTGVDDDVVDGDVGYYIVTGSVVSLNSIFHGFNPPDIPVTNLDNDTDAIPTVNEWGMIILALLLGAFSFILMKRRV